MQTREHETIHASDAVEHTLSWVVRIFATVATATQLTSADLSLGHQLEEQPASDRCIPNGTISRPSLRHIHADIHAHIIFIYAMFM